MDLVHLTSGGDDPRFLKELRLQHLQRLSPGRLHRLAAGGRPKWRRAVAIVASWIEQGEALDLFTRDNILELPGECRC